MQSACRALAISLTKSSASARNARGRAWSVLQQGRLSTTGVGIDTHDDFKPIQKASDVIISVQEQIEKDIKENPVLLYMKGDPENPQCGFSALATRILQANATPFASRNILADQELREALKKFSNWPTFPQLYINGEFIGGSDILKKMHESGELKDVLKTVPQK